VDVILFVRVQMRACEQEDALVTITCDDPADELGGDGESKSVLVLRSNCAPHLLPH
jgi:hypothetical protein